MEFPAPVAAFWQAYLATRRDAAPPRLDPDPLWRFIMAQGIWTLGQAKER